MYFLFLLAALVVAVGVRLLLRRRAPGVPAWVRILGVVIVMMGGVLGYTAFERLANELSIQKSWPTVTGNVIESKVIGEPSYFPEVIVAFEVAGETYTVADDHNVPQFGNKRKMYEVAEKTIAEYPEGAEVTVFYNPNDPSEAAIWPEPRWNDYFQSGLGVLLVAAGIFLAALPSKRPGRAMP